MKLNINDGESIDQPIGNDVTEQLEELEVDEFLILESEPHHYMQVYRFDDHAFQLEFRDGSEDRHFGADPDSVKLDQVVRAFLLYLDQDDSYRDLLDWEPVDMKDDEFVDPAGD